jgi:FKBP-type peptidyl-prolyl cis-trans isomerase
MMRIFLLASLSCLLFACGYSDKETQTFDQQIKKYINKNKLNLKPTGSGLYLKVDTLGTGRKIQFNDSIWVKYQLFLLSGERIENQDKPVGLPLAGLIKAWQEALFQLPVGSHLRCIAPPQLAYGQAGTDKISKDKILYFEMTIVDAK